MSFEECKEQVAKDNGWPSFEEAEEKLSSHNFGILNAMAAELYAKWAYNKALEDVCQGDNAWPLTEVLKKLAEATDILLHKKDYDGHGWEEMEICFKRAKELEESIRKLKK